MGSEARRKKAHRFLAEAKALSTISRWEGTANRLYYAIYQAVVAEFEAPTRNWKPKDVDPEHVQPDYPDNWPHTAVRLKCDKVNVRGREMSLIQSTWDLRMKADYRPDPVVQGEVRYLLEKVPGLLQSLGVDAS